MIIHAGPSGKRSHSPNSIAGIFHGRLRSLGSPASALRFEGEMFELDD